MLGVCVGGGAEPVEPVVVEGLVPGFEVEVLPAWVDVELEADVLPPSAALQRWFFGGGKDKLSNAVNALCFEEKHESKCTKKTEL